MQKQARWAFQAIEKKGKCSFSTQLCVKKCLGNSYLAIMLRIFRDITIYILLCAATFLMTKGIVRYYPLRDDIGFLRFKQPFLNNPLWKASFYVHVFSIIPVLLAGFTQFSRHILNEHKRLHRLMGKIYAYDILLVNVPVAMVLAVNANGLLPGRIAFVTLDCLWFWFTLKAVAEARKGHFVAHRRYMIRSYALTLSAVMLRSWKLIILLFVYVDELHLYMIDAWMGFVPNLLFAEWLIRSGRLPFKTERINYQPRLGKKEQ